MPNYPGRRAGTRRLVLWHQNKPHEKVIDGTKRDGDAYLAKWRMELETQGLVAVDHRVSLRFLEFCERHYRPYAETNLKGTTWTRSRIYQVARLESYFGSFRLSEIGRVEQEQFKKLRRKEIGDGTLNEELTVLGTILNYAKECGFTVQDARASKLETPEPRSLFWTEKELARLFAEAREESHCLMRMLVFLANTGCRKGECVAAEWSWIDLDSGMIRIPSNQVWRSKSGRPREVPISRACRTILAGPRESPRWVFPRPTWGKGERHAVFPMGPFWAARDRAKLIGGPHVMRHTFASHFLRSVPDLFLLAKVLGHSHSHVTERYSHLLPDHLERARNAVDIGAGPGTMARTMAASGKSAVLARKTS